MNKNELILAARNIKNMQRFIATTQFKNGCVEWMGSPNRTGYGCIKLNGVMCLSHRVSWSWANSAVIPDGLYVCHACDNPICVNPDHLWIGTPLDNMKDCEAKGRAHLGTGHKHNTGSRNYMSKLNNEKARQIRSLKAKGMRTIDIAAMFNVSNCLVNNIVAFRAWRDFQDA